MLTSNNSLIFALLLGLASVSSKSLVGDALRKLSRATACESNADRPHDYCDTECPDGWDTNSFSCGIFSGDFCCLAPDGFTTTPLPPTTDFPIDQCGKSKYGCNAGANRIVGGSDAFPNEYPWTASLLYLGDHQCGGTLINSEWIVTAAQCVDGGMADPRRWQVLLGAHDIDDGSHTEQLFNAIQIIIHERYVRLTYDYDVALIKLDRPAMFNQDVRHVCLVDSTASQLAGDLGIVAGWGFREAGGSISDVLQDVSIPIIEQSECERLYSQYTITDRMMCALSGEGGRDSCAGDSGGAMMVKNQNIMFDCDFVQVGIVSWGVGCGVPDQPGVYTRMSSVVDWVYQHASLGETTTTAPWTTEVSTTHHGTTNSSWNTNTTAMWTTTYPGTTNSSWWNTSSTAMWTTTYPGTTNSSWWNTSSTEMWTTHAGTTNSSWTTNTTTQWTTTYPGTTNSSWWNTTTTFGPTSTHLETDSTPFWTTTTTAGHETTTGQSGGETTTGGGGDTTTTFGPTSTHLETTLETDSTPFWTTTTVGHETTTGQSSGETTTSGGGDFSSDSTTMMFTTAVNVN